MTRYYTDPRTRHWEQFGLAAGLGLVLVNWVALVTPFLSGPAFHPVLIMVGVLLAFGCALALGGVGRDGTERDY